MIAGQINRGSLFGEHIYNISRRSDVQTIVEIGTWNGMGSTKCIYDAVLGSKKQVWSLECNRIFHEQAKTNLNAVLLPANFKLVLGSIVTVEELQQFTGTLPGPEYEKWLSEDIGWVRNCPNVLDQLPEKIDLYIIDGGEMSGWIEFEKLWKRCNYIMLDDTLALKHIQTRAFILGNPDKFKVIDDNTRERQGYLVCEVLKID